MKVYWEKKILMYYSHNATTALTFRGYTLLVSSLVLARSKIHILCISDIRFTSLIPTNNQNYGHNLRSANTILKTNHNNEHGCLIQGLTKPCTSKILALLEVPSVLSEYLFINNEDKMVVYLD